MVDPISLTVAITASIIAILSHIKKSKCCGIEIQTRNTEQEKKEEKPPDEFDSVAL